MIEQLRSKIIEANEAYRSGKPIMSDSKYDQLVEELTLLSPNDELLTKVGVSVTDESRKSKLPIDMASMNKIKSIDDIHDWIRLKNIVKCAEFVITPKFDGLSLCVDEGNNDAWTRGDGVYGQKSNEHYKLIQNHLYEDVFDFESNPSGRLDDHDGPLSLLPFNFTYGEVMMPKKVFIDKYSEDFANPRNLVAGLLNSKEPSEALSDCQYIKYGAIPSKGQRFKFKSDILKELNKGQRIKVPFEICSLEDMTEEFLIGLFHKWSVDYEIDGLIIEVDHLGLQESLGRETSSNNPCYARAFKHPSFEQSAETEVIGISWNISKQGYLKPTLHVKPVKLDGVTVSNVTGNNARFVKDLGLGVGAIVTIKRSGMVIPLITDVITPVDFVMPDVPNIDWNDNGVELMTLTETDDQKLKKLVAFFEILEADNVSEGIIKQLWDAGYQTIESILNLTQSDLEKIDRFGKRKAQIVFTSIQKCIKDVQLSKLQHATGIFKGLGKLRLVKLEHFTKKPSLEEVMMIDGFAESSAKSYIDGYDTFFDFIKNLPITIAKKESINKTGNDLEGTTFVFTGVRRSDLVKIIESRGGKEGTSVSKNTTHLVCVDKNSSSSKMNKARELGVKILDVNDLEKLLS